MKYKIIIGKNKTRLVESPPYVLFPLRLFLLISISLQAISIFLVSGSFTNRFVLHVNEVSQCCIVNKQINVQNYCFEKYTFTICLNCFSIPLLKKRENCCLHNLTFRGLHVITSVIIKIKHSFNSYKIQYLKISDVTKFKKSQN